MSLFHSAPGSSDPAVHAAVINEAICRRQFFRRGGTGLGVAALSSLIADASAPSATAGLAGLPHRPPRAKRAIFLSMIGAPSQFETFDYKPKLASMHREDMSEFLKQSGQRLTTMTSNQKGFPAVASQFKFSRHGQNGVPVSELLPHTAKMVDDIRLIYSMHTDAINHEPANQLMFTGSMQSGKASIGSWLSYGLGSMNQDLPTFVVLHASNTGKLDTQAISSRFWGAGYLPGRHAGVALRSAGDPVLYLRDTPGIDRQLRGQMIENLNRINDQTYQSVGDPEIQTRMKSYEMAYRMQSSVPELTDLGGESQATLDMYGPDAHRDGTFARSCLMARRLIERDVRFVQIFHRGWDQHGNLPKHISAQCRDIDQASWALVQDLKQRGLLDDTLVVWGGEFGRTVYSQGKITDDNYGRDHHPRCFTMWMAGGGVTPGTYGRTDELSFNIEENPVHVRDLHATLLHQLGIDHERLSFKFQGLDQRLTGVEPAHVLHDILA